MRNPLTKQASNTPNSTNKLCVEFSPRNPEYSSIMDSDNSINKSTPNNSNSNIQIETANIPHSLFAFNRPTDQLLSQLNNFQRIANKLRTVYMMSHSNSDEETLLQIKQSTPYKVRFADEAGPSTAPAVPATPVTLNTDTTTVTSPSVGDLYLDIYNFALSKIFSSTLMASLTSKNAILKEIRDCILTESEDRCTKNIAVHTLTLERPSCQEWMCLHRRQDSSPSCNQRCLRRSHTCHSP